MAAAAAMIAIDTNLLVSAHRSAAPKHAGARRAIESALNAPGGCGITLPSVAEFFSIIDTAAAGSAAMTLA